MFPLVKNWKDPNGLDLIGLGKTYHGNYAAVRSKKAVKQYCSKVCVFRSSFAKGMICSSSVGTPSGNSCTGCTRSGTLQQQKGRKWRTTFLSCPSILIILMGWPSALSTGCTRSSQEHLTKCPVLITLFILNKREGTLSPISI